MRTGHIPSSLSVRLQPRRLAGLFLFSLAPVFFFFSCNGNGGGSDSQGELYFSESLGNNSGNGGGNSSNGGDLSAWDIKELANGGMTDEIVARLTGGGEEEEETKTFTVSFSAADLQLPAGGWLTLEISGADDDYKKSASAYPDGNVYFTIPKLPIGTIVTVTLSAYGADGTPYSSGYASKRIQKDEENYINVPLTNLPPLPTIAYGGNGSLNGNSADKDGSSYTVIEYTGESLSMTVTNSDPDSLLEVELNGAACSASETLPDGFNTITATVTKSPALPSVVTTRQVYVVKALTEPTVTFPNGTKTGTSGSYELWKYSYLAASDYSNLLVTVTNSYDGDNSATGGHSTMTVSGLTGGPYTDGSEVSRKVVPDGDSSITITVSKDYCTDVTVTKYIRASIKPVTVSVSQFWFVTNFSDADGPNDVYGTVSLGKNGGGYQPLYTFSSEQCSNGSWKLLGHNGVTFTLSSKTDYMSYKSEDMKESDSTSGDDDIGEVYTDASLSALASTKRSGGTPELYVASGGEQPTEHRIYLNLSD